MLLLLALLVLLAAPGFAATSNHIGCQPFSTQRVVAAVDDHDLITLQGNLHPLATSQNDAGKVDDDMPLEHIILMLHRSPDQEAALNTRIDQMHNRRSPYYHQWLRPEEIGACYGPVNPDIAAVTVWLQKHGFKIDTVPAGKTMIIFTGTAGQVRDTFHTEIHNLNVHGEKHIANMSEPQIPKALAPVIAGFQSLNNFFPKPLSHIVGPMQRDPKTGKWNLIEQGDAKQSRKLGTPLLTLSNGLLWVGPQDFYTIYDETPLLKATPTPINGAGQILAIVQESDVNPADVTTFRSQFGLPAYPSTPTASQGGVVFMFGISGYCTDPGILGPNNGGVESEADIDVQWMGTTAPAATIDFVSCSGTNTTAGVNLSLAYIVNNLAGTVSAFSFSFGTCEADVDQYFGETNSFYNGAYQQAVAEGQTPVVAAGDTGDNTCDRGNGQGPNGQDISVTGLSVSGQASTPYNVATGGTDFSDAYSGTTSSYWNSNDTSPYGSALSYIPEIAWDNSCASTIIAAAVGATPEEICNDTSISPPEGLTDLDGGSGGVSSIYSLPTWQSAYGVGLSSNFSSTTNRNMPDISLFASDGASPAGIIWGHTLVFCESDLATCDYSNTDDAIAMASGGTSFVAPMFAGILALVNQAWPSGNPAQPTMQGQANYTLYALGTAEYGIPGTPNTSTTAPSIYTCEASNVNAINTYGSVMQDCIFNEINRTPAAGTTTCVGGTTDATCLFATNDEPCEAGSTNCYVATNGDAYGLLSVSSSPFEAAYVQSAGYNDVTGLGSLNITNLVANWTAFTPLFPSTTGAAANPASMYTTDSVSLTALVTATGRGSLAPPMGTVSFYAGTACSGTAIGTANLIAGTGGNGEATATLATTGAQVGTSTTNLTACFSGDGANDATSNDTTAITVTQTAFTLAAQSSSVTITAGQSGNVQLNLSANTSVAASGITFACSGLPSGDSCTVPALTGSIGTTATSVTMTIQTASASANMVRPGSRASLMFAFMLPAMLLLGTTGSRKWKIRLLLLAVALIAMLGWLGCGSSSSSTSTGGQPQTYNVTVTASLNGATAGTSGTISVTVNP